MNLDEIRQNTIAQRTNTQNQLNNLANEKTNALNNINTSYNDMIDNSQTYYEQQAQATKDYADTQQALQKEQNDFLIEKINQQKDQTKKDYVKEQKGAYADYMRANDEYGVNRERLAQQGLTNGGYEASADYKYYNTYQNRVANARDTYNKAILNYDNSIKDAMLQNNSKLAEISYNALQSQLQLALEGFQYKNGLLQQQLSTQMSIDSDYYGRYQNVLAQINHENQFKYQQERDRIADQQWQKQYNLQLANSRKSSGGSSKSSKKSSSSEQQVNSEQKATPSPKEIMDNIKMIQGPGLTNNIKDGLTGKTYSSVDSLMASHNYYYNNGTWYYKD